MGSVTARPASVSCAVACSLGFVLGTPSSNAGFLLQKVPALTVEDAPRYPQNLAQLDLGARLIAEPNPILSTALLSADPTSLCPLEKGVTTFLISLPQIENIDTVAFLNEETAGSVAIATASAKLESASAQWHNGEKREVPNGLVSFRVGPTEAKYIRLVFDVRTPGRISNLGILSAAPVSDFTVPRPRKIGADSTIAGTSRINLADLHGQARIIFVSSGNDVRLANNMLDHQAASAYVFAPNDTIPAAIIDLGRALPINRISTFSTSRGASASFYVFDSLPADSGTSSPQTLPVDPQLLPGVRIVGTAADNETGRVAIDFQETTARYVMICWTPSARVSNFSVAEIAVLGPVTDSTLLVLNRGSARADNKNVRDSKDAKDSKDVKDFSKEIPAEGPGEAQPPAEGPPPSLPRSPPFVFIPRVVPTSP
jgi:hypothetical protein